MRRNRVILPVILFFIIGITWIALSDYFIDQTNLTDTTAYYVQFIKGLLFIILTTAFISILLLNRSKRIKILDKEIEEKEREYQDLIENLNNAVYKVNEDGKINYLSPQVFEMTGFKPAELEGSDIISVIHPDDHKRLEKVFEETLSGHRSEYEFRALRKDGSYFWIQLVGKSVSLPNGKKVINGVIIDIDQRKKMQNHILLMNDILFRLNKINTIDEGLKFVADKILSSQHWDFAEIWQLNESDEFELLDCVTFNEESLTKFQYQSKRRTFKFGEGLIGRAAKERDPIWLENLQSISEKKFHRTDKIKETNLNTCIAIPINYDGGVESVIVFYTKLSKNEVDFYDDRFETLFTQIGIILKKKNVLKELKKHKNELATLVDERTNELNEQNQFLTTFLNTIPNPVFIKDRNGIFIDINNAFESFIGIQRKDVIGKKIEEFESQITAEEAYKNEDKLLKQKQIIRYESVIERPERKIPILVYKASFGPENEPPAGITGLIIDMTPIKNAEQAMEDALQSEKELNKMKTNFVAMVSHEFRTPLSSILASADSLELYRDKWPPQKTNSQIERIQTSVLKMVAMLDDILMISRTDREKITLQSREINMKLFMEEQKNNKSDSLGKNQEIELSYKSSTGDMVFADPFLIEHIVDNILTNAIKYSGDNTKIDFSCEVANDFINIKIRDEGIGIPKDELNNIFEPFYRTATVARIKGSGLGLSIVKRFIEIYNGTIEVNSELNVGTTFKICLPILGKDDS